METQFVFIFILFLLSLDREKIVNAILRSPNTSFIAAIQIVRVRNVLLFLFHFGFIVMAMAAPARCNGI